MKTYFIVLIISLLAFSELKSQTQIEGSDIKWYTLEEAMKLNEKSPRILFIDMYTDWCGWCKKMMKTTFSNKYIANYINQNFYPIRFDAEGKDSIVFQGKTYFNKKKTHDLAIELLNGRLSYPSIVYMKTGKNPFKVVIPGYKDVRKQEPILYYFAERAYLTTPFPEYEKFFQFTYAAAHKNEISKLSDSQKPDTLGVVKWYNMNELAELQKKNPRKVFLDIYAPWMISSKMMVKTTYTNQKIAKLLNENFYPVRFDAVSKDTVLFAKQKLINENRQHPFHDLTVSYAVSGNRIYFPTTVYFDEKLQVITKLQEYLTPEILLPFLEYISGNAYKKQSWAEYRDKLKTKK